MTEPTTKELAERLMELVKGDAAEMGDPLTGYAYQVGALKELIWQAADHGKLKEIVEWKEGELP